MRQNWPQIAPLPPEARTLPWDYDPGAGDAVPVPSSLNLVKPEWFLYEGGVWFTREFPYQSRDVAERGGILKLAIRCNSRMLKRSLLILFLIEICYFSAHPVSAQTGGPVYIVQSGDTLSFIALRFNVTVDELIAANPSVDPDLLAEGQQIVIPGPDGISGILQTEVIAFGDTLRSLSRRTQVSDTMFRRLNRLVSPTELYVGASMIIPKQEGQQTLNTRMTPAAGESLLELAIKQGNDPWSLVTFHRLRGTWEALPGDVLFSSTGNREGKAIGLPSVFSSAEVTPLPLVQGGTGESGMTIPAGTTLSGLLGRGRG